MVVTGMVFSCWASGCSVVSMCQSGRSGQKGQLAHGRPIFQIGEGRRASSEFICCRLARAEHSSREKIEQIVHHRAEDLRCGLDQDPDVQADDVYLVPVDQFPVADCCFAIGEAINNDASGDALGCGRLASNVSPPTDSSTKSAPAPLVSRRTSAAMVGLRESMTCSAPSARITSCLPGEAAAITVAP